MRPRITHASAQTICLVSRVYMFMLASEERKQNTLSHASVGASSNAASGPSMSAASDMNRAGAGPGQDAPAGTGGLRRRGGSGFRQGWRMAQLVAGAPRPAALRRS
eukprot:CAMPEP_0202037796 /NCGR_PEP_ID=MMETSP0962-20130828/2391_1 /ASSEMBLY_ACC=CAM_ASM_000488 /TAXON_ID=4773 /ORGANISM="Schizochytrium aggregatum, Strain ATCC28209" /LENGTH=105 /DNA_ID=CAMNT_0048601923 /DNA_START=213 /DNA_END=531 /DNA_ORIENTATION=+